MGEWRERVQSQSQVLGADQFRKAPPLRLRADRRGARAVEQRRRSARPRKQHPAFLERLADRRDAQRSAPFVEPRGRPATG